MNYGGSGKPEESMNPEASLPNQPMDISIVASTPGTSGDSMGQAPTVQDNEGSSAERSLGEAIAVNSNVGQKLDSSQMVVPTIGENEKGESNEMMYTVVTIDNSISELIQSSLNNGGFAKGVQLSLVPSSSDNDTASTGGLPLSAAQGSTAFDQLALIAASVQASQQQEEEGQQFSSEKKADNSKPSSSFTVTSLEALNENSNKAEEDKDSSSSGQKKRRVRCDVCDQDFSDLPSMRRHRLIHSDDKPYQCEFCEKAFRRKDNLREHRNIHTLENVYPCTRCGKTFPRKYTHKVHMARFCTKDKPNNESSTSTGDEVIGWETDAKSPRSCAKSSSKSSVSNNTKCSEPCHICLKTFRDSSTLKRHLLTHSEDRPFKCEECNKSFRRKDHLQEHVIVHNEVRPFACQQCGKSFSRKNGLKTHMIRTSHGPHVALSSFPVQSSTDRSQESKNDEPAAEQDTNNEFQLVLTTNQELPRNSDENNGNDVANILPENDSTRTESVNVDFPKINMDSETSDVNLGHDSNSGNGVNPGNSVNPRNGVNPGNGVNPRSGVNLRNGVNPGNGVNLGNSVSAMDGLKGTETTVVISEKMREPRDVGENDSGSSARHNAENFIEFDGDGHAALASSKENDKEHSREDNLESKDENVGQVGGNQSDENNGEALQCPNCPVIVQTVHKLWLHFQEHLAADVFACEHCLATFTAPELFKEHQKKCVDGIAGNARDTSSDPQAKLGEIVSAGEPQSEKTDVEMSDVSRDTLGDKGDTMEDTQGDTSQGSDNEDLDKAGGSGVGGSDVNGKGERTCLVCNKEFRDTTALRRHSLVHSGERPHACDQCDKRFRRRDHLKSHVTAYHCGTATFPCKNCETVFNTRYSLTIHSKSCKKPVVVRPQTTILDASKLSDIPESKSCPICNKSFKDPSTQRRHLRIHSEERPFPCDLCPKSFRRKDNLKEHMLCHSDQKPFSCEDCGKALSRRSSLTNHRTICPMRKLDTASMVLDTTTIPETTCTEPLPEDTEMCVSGTGDNQELTSSDMNDPSAGK